MKQIIYTTKWSFRPRIVLLDGNSVTCMPGHIKLESLCYFKHIKVTLKNESIDFDHWPILLSNLGSQVN